MLSVEVAMRLYNKKAGTSDSLSKAAYASFVATGTILNQVIAEI